MRYQAGAAEDQASPVPGGYKTFESPMVTLLIMLHLEAMAVQCDNVFGFEATGQSLFQLQFRASIAVIVSKFQGF